MMIQAGLVEYRLCHTLYHNSYVIVYNVYNVFKMMMILLTFMSLIKVIELIMNNFCCVHYVITNHISKWSPSNTTGIASKGTSKSSKTRKLWPDKFSHGFFVFHESHTLLKLRCFNPPFMGAIPSWKPRSSWVLKWVWCSVQLANSCRAFKLSY